MPFGNKVFTIIANVFAPRIGGCNGGAKLRCALNAALPIARTTARIVRSSDRCREA